MSQDIKYQFLAWVMTVDVTVNLTPNGFVIDINDDVHALIESTLTSNINDFTSQRKQTNEKYFNDKSKEIEDILLQEVRGVTSEYDLTVNNIAIKFSQK